MKIIIFSVLLVALVAVVASQDVPTLICPEGEHSVLYCPRKAEPTCDNPTIHDIDGPAACGIPDCWCNEGTVRNTADNECVQLEDCPED